MLNFTKYDVFAFDSKCIFAAVKDQNHWSLVSTVNEHSVCPNNEDWFSKSSIFNQISSDKLDTAITLLNKDNSISSYGFAFNLKIDSEKIPSIDASKAEFLKFLKYENEREKSKMSLIKQGLDNIDGVFDSFITIAKCNDGYAIRLTVKIYFLRTNKINLQTLVFDIDESMIDKLIRIYASIDVDENIALLYLNEKLMKTYPMQIFDKILLPLNKPFHSSYKMNHIVIGDDKDFVNLNAIAIFKHKLSMATINSIKAAFS